MKRSLILITLSSLLLGCSKQSNDGTDIPSSSIMPSTPAPMTKPSIDVKGNGATLLKLGQSLDDIEFTSYKFSKSLNFGIMTKDSLYSFFIENGTKSFSQKAEFIHEKNQDYKSIKISNSFHFGESLDILGVKISPEISVFVRSLTMGQDSLLDLRADLKLNARMLENINSYAYFSFTKNNFGTENKFMIAIQVNF